MGSVKVTVYGRVKPCFKSCRNQEYQLKYGDHDDQITFISNKIPSGKKTYRFKKIFSENTSQETIFERVAKPIIKSVLTGYNGTIFTYGQTGSGKTYTMTGDIEQWLNPGLIPRTVQEIFKQKSWDTPISITYCEIYNEHVYDLIRMDRVDTDMPQVSLVEDPSGITHFRNLSVHLVSSALEALQLLVRGDANKMVAETSSNVRSSRSHVIFSIGLEFPHPTEEKLCMKPVLYLVDLAGSEKLSKCKTSMGNPLETRFINLSLHYLEQVLIALRQPGRNHIPYRNSLMTALLRNSLGGNCITAMIATFSLTLDDFEETLQTCRFAERIALIKNEIKLNELLDPQKEILQLKKENDKLKAQVRMLSLPQEASELTDKDRVKCEEMVKSFIKGNDVFDLPLSNLKRLEYCFQLMRNEILNSLGKDVVLKKTDKHSHEVLEILKNDSTFFTNFHFETKTNEENEVKIIETSSGRKRTPMDLPKINLTYKRWKSTEHITENESADVRKLSSKDLKLVDPNLSDSCFPSRKLKDTNSNPSGKKIAGKTAQVKENLDSYVMDGCLLKIKGSELSSKQNSDTTITFPQEIGSQGMGLTNPAASNLDIKNDLPDPNLSVTTNTSPTSSEEIITFEEVKKLCGLRKTGAGTSLESTFIELQQKRLFNSMSSTRTMAEETSSNHSYDAVIFQGKSLPFTGDKEVDEEILKFYKARYESLRNK